MESRLPSVESRVVFPQGSVLCLVLFLIHVNDLDDGVTLKISEFADDTKIASKVITTLDKELGP